MTYIVVAGCLSDVRVRVLANQILLSVETDVSPIPLDFKAARAESFPAVAIYDAKRKAAIWKRLNGIIHPIALSRCGANSRLPAVMDVDFPFHLYGLH